MEAPELLKFSADEKRLLITLAHEAIQAAILARPKPDPPVGRLTDRMSTLAATFVTLLSNGQLRGCVGNLIARDPLYCSVTNNAVGAARRDTRFAPVTLEESQGLEIHISVLSPLVPLKFRCVADLLDQLAPGVDGVVLRQAGRTSTYLPQVWTSFPDKEAFLGSLSRKAGLDSSAWRTEGAEVQIYRVTEFGDTAIARK